MKKPLIALLYVLLFLNTCLFSKVSHAAIERKTDNFSGITTISSVTNAGIFVDFSTRMAFDSVTFSKILERSKPPQQERSLDEYIINIRINADEKACEILSNHCPAYDQKKIIDALAYLSQAKEELQKKCYNLADYFEWKARETIGIIRTEAFTLTLAIKNTKEWWFFSKENFEIKIDRNPYIHQASVLNTNSQMYNNNLVTTMTITIPKDLIDQIKNANSLTCKVYFSDSNAPREPSVFEINGATLGEWKTVISGTE